VKIELSKPFASNSLVEEYDVVQVKKALNRLGYYFPYEKVGITGIADKGVFETLKKFQKDHNLPATGTAKPDDETIKTPQSTEASKRARWVQYIWRTVEDGKVRAAHAQYNRTMRAWSDPQTRERITIVAAGRSRFPILQKLERMLSLEKEKPILH
jgi:peptidoglycan hydrolase-like protein with peptidoglycan-binding domain